MEDVAGRNITRALKWISSVLERNEIPHQFVGGLAARAYGSRRDLADIDIYVPGSRFKDILPEVGIFVVSGPSRVRSEHWDLDVLVLEFAGVKIELGDSEDARYFDALASRWVPAEIDYSASVKKTVYGTPIPLISLPGLVEYKSRLLRPVDRQDLAALERDGDP